MRLVAESFSWPFRGAWRSTWAIGLIAVLFLPLLFVFLLGYSVDATRTAETDPAAGPPPWRMSWRLISDGAWISVAVLVTTLPFDIFVNPLAAALREPARGEPFAHVFALLILALPWGLLALIVLPHGTAVFAASRRPADLFNFAASVRCVARDFATWNAVVAAIVTAWAVGLACVGLLFAGIVPGVFYAILVSAHAAATLHAEGPRPNTSSR